MIENRKQQRPPFIQCKNIAFIPQLIIGLINKFQYFQLQQNMKLILTLFLAIFVSGSLQHVYSSSNYGGQTATYTWTIRVSGTYWWLSDYPLDLYFPYGSGIRSNCAVYVNGIPTSFARFIYSTMHGIRIPSYIYSAYLTVVVTNVDNPYYGGDFFYKTPKDGFSNNYYLYFQDSYYSNSNSGVYGSSTEKGMRMFFIGTFISLAWIGFVAYYYQYRNNKTIYLPYAIIFVTSIFQVLLLSINIFCLQTSLLNYKIQEKTWVQKITASTALFGLGYGLTVLRNIVYLCIFCREIIPKFENHQRQANYFVAILIGMIAAFTSFQFGYLLYSRMSLTIFIPVRHQAQLLNLNRFSKFTLIINFVLAIGCGLGILNATQYFLHLIVQNRFLVMADLLGSVAINTIITLVFLIKDKPQEYYFRDQMIANYSSQVSNFSMGSFNQSMQQIAPSVIQKSDVKIKAPMDQGIQEIKLEKTTAQSQQSYKWRVLSIDF